MANFQKKSGTRRILESKPVLVLLALLMLLFAYGVMGFGFKMIETSKNKKIAEEKVAELTASKQKLSADITRLQTPEGTEASIRERFGLAKEGEGLIIVVDDKNPPEVQKKDTSGLWGFFTKWLK